MSSPTLADLARELRSVKQPGGKTLIYGNPKTGKTRLAGTALKLNDLKRIIWFDLENGVRTLFNPELGLTEEHMSKVTLVQIEDNSTSPRAIETILKFMSSKEDSITICNLHQKVDCRDKECKSSSSLSSSSSYTIPTLKGLNSSDLVVIDSATKLAESAMVVGMKIADALPKANAFAKYSEQGNLLSAVFTMMQTSKTNFIITSLATTAEDSVNLNKEQITPACGTRNYGLQLAARFDNVIYLTIEVKKFKGGSSPVYKLNTVAGSREGRELDETMDLSKYFSS